MAQQGNMYRLARTLGLARLIGADQEGSPAMTAQTRMAMVLFTTGQQDINTTRAEGLQRAADDAQLHASSLGERPLIVLASGQNMEHLPYWPEAQRLMAALSTTGQLTVVEGSGHSIHVEQPAVVIDAVRQVVAQVRSH
jgi:pimeloyl-ACP methyl ester carboxylesterase